jgi:hypothetical protein
MWKEYKKGDNRSYESFIIWRRMANCLYTAKMEGKKMKRDDFEKKSGNC